MQVEIVQYMRPNGRPVNACTELPDVVSADYLDMVVNDCCLEAEVLSTGEVSLTISDGEEDVDIEVVSNVPEVVNGYVKMLKRRNWNDKVGRTSGNP